MAKPKKLKAKLNCAKMSINLDNSAMQQLQTEQCALLETMDNLRVLGITEHVDLPKLIVVGDRSAGKSSVLEAVSRVSFPINDGVCTRFAIELALLRSPHTQVAVTVQNESLDTFSRSGFDKGDLPRIVEEAKEHMGITGDSSAFSEDVLRIEIAGPDVPQLTLVDLPGFFHDDAKPQDLGGEEVVNRLAEKYMSQENNIILAVISAQKDLASQKVLNKAKKHDPDQVRTLGILTKPDEVEEESTNEQTYVKLAQNEEPSHKLKLGWHVLRNRDQEDADSTGTERDEDDVNFFRAGPWGTVSSQNHGIDTLREKLSQILANHIQRKLPGVIVNIEEQIKTCQTRLERLGVQRSSTDDIKKYLINISNRFQRVAREAIHGNYADIFFGGLYPNPQTSYEDRRVKKLRALVRDLNRAFYFVLTTKGGRRQIHWDGDTAPEVPHHLAPLTSLYTLGEHIEISIDDLTNELDKMASENQGVEFPGSLNGRVALALFRDQSASWEAIASQHVDLVSHFSRRFVEQLVGHVTSPDLRTTDAVIRNIVTPYFEQKQETLRAKVSELLQHYKSGSDPQPMYYDDFLDSKEQQREQQRAKKISQLMREDPELFKCKANTIPDHTVMALKVAEATSEVVDEFNAEQTIDNAMEYYDTSLKIFTDNVATLALENCLISDIPNILSPEMVYDMNDDKITMLAAESKQTQREREELQMQLEKLRKALAACREHRPRHSSGMTATLPVFSIVEPESLLPGRTKPGTSVRTPPNLPGSGPGSSSIASMDGQGPTTQTTGPWNAFRPVAATTQSASGETKPCIPRVGLFATALPSGSTSIGTSSPSDTPNSGNTVGSFLLSRSSNPSKPLFGTAHTEIAAQNSSSVAKKPEPSSGGTSLFGQKTKPSSDGTSLFGQKTVATAGGTSMFGQKTVATAGGTSLFGQKTVPTPSGTSLSGQKTGTTAGGALVVAAENPATTAIRTFTGFK